MSNRYPYRPITASERASYRRKPRRVVDTGDFDDMGRREYDARYHYAQKRDKGRF